MKACTNQIHMLWLYIYLCLKKHIYKCPHPTHPGLVETRRRREEAVRRKCRKLHRLPSSSFSWQSLVKQPPVLQLLARLRLAKEVSIHSSSSCLRTICFMGSLGLFYSFPKLFVSDGWFLRWSSCWSGCPDHGSLLQSRAGWSSSGRTRTRRTWSYGATTRKWRTSSTWSRVWSGMLSTARRMCSGRPPTATSAATAWLWCLALCPPAKGSSRCRKSARISVL